MAPLSLVLTLALAGAAGDPVARWQPEIAEASRRCAIPQEWIARVMRAESGGETTRGGKPIRSPKGAIGLMQLMPATWIEMRSRLGLGADPDDPLDNIVAGACYLRLLYARFGFPGLFGAYNAGPARYAGYLAGRARLPLETISYLRGVAPARLALPHQGKPATLFAVRRDAQPGTAGSTEVGAIVLFAIRNTGQ